MRLFVRTAALAGALLSFLTFGVSAEPTKIRFSIYLPTSHYLTQYFQTLTEKMTAAANGAVTVELYHSESLGKSTEQWEVAEEGLADISGTVSAIFYPSRMTLSAFFELPFVNEDGITSNKVIQRVMEKGLFDSEYKSVVLLSAFNSPPAQVFSTRPLKSVEDFKGLRVVGQGPIWTQTWSLLGAQGVSMGWPDIYLALERGTVDAAPGNWAASKGWKWAEVAPYPLEIGMMGGFFIAVIANQKSWDALPEEVKSAWKPLLKDMPREIAQLGADAEEAGRQFARDSGREITQFPPDERKKMAAKLRPIWEDWMKRNIAAGKPAAEVYQTYVEVMKEEGKPVVIDLPMPE